MESLDRAAVEDLVVAHRVLAKQSILDAFGHASIRSPSNPGRFLLPRSVAPELVSAEDIMEHDLDGVPVDPQGRKPFLERFIHSSIYKAHPEVGAVVHSHSTGVIPFSVSTTPMRPIFVLGAFLSGGVPIFDTRSLGGGSDMLITNAGMGDAMASHLGRRPALLLRGHGSVVAAPNIQLAVFRVIYLETNARLQSQAIALGGEVTYLNPEEAEKLDGAAAANVSRPWELWKKQVLG